MTSFEPHTRPTLLLRARRAGQGGGCPAGAIAAAAHPQTLEQGVAAQVALAGLLGACRPAGFKIGATAGRMQEYLGLSGPAAGFMAEAGLHGERQHVAARRFFRPGVECELGRPPRPRPARRTLHAGAGARRAVDRG